MKDANERIEERIERDVSYYSVRPEEEVRAHLRRLEAEWDVERALGTNASVLALTGAVLGVTRNRKWFLLTAGVMGFLMQHATQGWCPPLPVLRRLGVRTRREIDREKYRIRAARGDFAEATAGSEKGGEQ